MNSSCLPGKQHQPEPTTVVTEEPAPWLQIQHGTCRHCARPLLRVQDDTADYPASPRWSLDASAPTAATQN